VEAATADFWMKYVGLDGHVVGMTSFGASAPAPQLFEQFGFTVPHVVDAVKRVIG
jgi:transketolase